MKLLIALAVITGVALCYVFTFALCKVAAQADEQDQRLWDKYLAQRSDNE